MQETISIEEVEGMLDAAHFHLHRLDDEYEKMSGRDPGALRAYIFASLVLGGSIFYTLTNPKSYVLNPFKKATTAWLSDLESKPDEYKFFNRMLHHHLDRPNRSSSIVDTSTFGSFNTCVFSAKRFDAQHSNGKPGLRR